MSRAYVHRHARVRGSAALLYKRVKDLPDMKHLMPDPERVPDPVTE